MHHARESKKNSDMVGLWKYFFFQRGWECEVNETPSYNCVDCWTVGHPATGPTSGAALGGHSREPERQLRAEERSSCLPETVWANGLYPTWKYGRRGRNLAHREEDEYFWCARARVCQSTTDGVEE